ncbi:MAG: AMIN domain-containing protein, partial [Alcaligenaceae bacterium]
MNYKNCLWLGCLRPAVVIAAAAFMTSFVFAKGSIESITGILQGVGETIRIELSEPLASIPSGFAIQSPARIALDFPGVTNGTGRSLIEINQGNIKSANIVEAGDRSRLVLNLKQPTAYQAELQGKSLLISLTPVTPAVSVAQAAPTVFAEDHNNNVLALRDLDFRRGNDGAGRVVVGLANNQVGVDLRQQGKSLVVEF